MSEAASDNSAPKPSVARPVSMASAMQARTEAACNCVWRFSALAPNQMNAAISIRIGRPCVSPHSPIPSASTWPMRVARSVARTRPILSASKARNARPPSMGKAGNRLNMARNRLAAARSGSRRLGPLSLRLANTAFGPSTAIITPAMTTLTSGPASATTNSCPGFSGIWSIRATPPIGSRMTSRVCAP